MNKFYLLLLLFFLLSNCHPPKAESVCDTTSKTYQRTAIFKGLIGDKTAFCGTKSPDAPAPPVVTNLLNKGIVQSGFLIGTAPEGVTLVEVSLDNGTYTAAVGTTNWKYQFPTGSNTWRDSTLHSISVRTKNGPGIFSTPVTLSARKGNNKDINGDGYADVVVGAPGYSTAVGRTYIFQSNGNSGISAIAGATSATAILTGITITTGFGGSVATGDLNGDGYADVIIGADITSASTGAVYIFYSGGSSGIASSIASSANVTIAGPAANSSFGATLATGDVNGDGFADVLVGAPNSAFSKAYIFQSAGTSGVTITTAITASSVISGTFLVDQFGKTVTFGDLNGDGFADAIIGADKYPNNTAVTGAVYIFKSNGTAGLAATITAISATTIITGEASTTAFALAIATGDINGDGFMDLITTDQFKNTGAGRAYILNGANSLLAGTVPALTSSNSILNGTGPGIVLGSSVTTGDVNGDGFSDAIFGCKTSGATSYGSAYIFHGTASGITNNITTVAANTAIIGTEANINSRFGVSVSASDINGDGYADLIAGADLVSSSQGQTHIFLSPGATGIAVTSISSATSTLTGEATSNQFGISIASLETWRPLTKLQNFRRFLFGSDLL